jgi:hypothetical protein
MDITQTTLYLDDLTALGVTLPTSTANARDIYFEALRATKFDPATDIMAAIEAGTVTPENVAELVQQAARDLGAQAHASQIVRDLHRTLNRAMRDGLRGEAGRIRRELRAVFDPAAAAITKAAQHFGPGTRAEDVINAKPEVVKMWREASAHTRTLDDVTAAYRALVLNVLAEQPEQIVSLFVDKPADIDHAAELYRGNGSWLALAHAGFKLRLNSPADAQAVMQAHEDVKAKAAAAEREKAIAANKYRHRFDLAAAEGRL